MIQTLRWQEMLQISLNSQLGSLISSQLMYPSYYLPIKAVLSVRKEMTKLLLEAKRSEAIEKIQQILEDLNSTQNYRLLVSIWLHSPVMHCHFVFQAHNYIIGNVRSEIWSLNLGSVQWKRPEYSLLGTNICATKFWKSGF